MCARSAGGSDRNATGWVRRGRGESGAAAVETALVLCFVVLPVVFATIGYAYMLSFRQTVSQSAAEGARAAAVAPQSTSDADRTTAATNAVNHAMASGPGGLACGTNHLTCTVTKVANCGDGSTHDCIQVTVSYPYRDHSLLPSVPGLGFTLPPTVSYTSVAEIS
ncbi:MAG TPA: TadE/TadG family type IV pilus assembly protein [Marmoricola sp.]